MPVIRVARNFLAHVPGLVRHGSKPARELAAAPTLAEGLATHLRPYEHALAYPPHHAFLGSLDPDALRERERPWFLAREPAPRWQSHGELMPEAELYGLLRIMDAFELVGLDATFTREVRRALSDHPLLGKADLERLGDGHPESVIEERRSCGGRVI
jgi:glycine/sarcosine/betaine reductase complex component C subunit beta